MLKVSCEPREAPPWLPVCVLRGKYDSVAGREYLNIRFASLEASSSIYLASSCSFIVTQLGPRNCDRSAVKQCITFNLTPHHRDQRATIFHPTQYQIPGVSNQSTHIETYNAYQAILRSNSFHTAHRLGPFAQPRRTKKLKRRKPLTIF